MKKLIALVLFVAMMAMMVPTASAVVVEKKITGEDTYIVVLDETVNGGNNKYGVSDRF